MPDAARQGSRTVHQAGVSSRKESGGVRGLREVRTDVAAGRGARVYCDDDAALKLEGEGRRAVVDLDAARRVRHVVRVELEERLRLEAEEALTSRVSGEGSRGNHTPVGRD